MSGSSKCDFRIGLGVDVHQLVPGRSLVLGGVAIPYEKGLAGHSDADVLIHAVIDACLGAIGERDIGFHFPNTDARYRDISSLVLLRKTVAILAAAKWSLGNLDCTITAEQPKLKDFIPQMKKNIAAEFAAEPALVAIKAGTAEGLGAMGRGEGIMAQAVVLVRKME